MSSSTFGIVAASQFRSVHFDFGTELPANCDKRPFIEMSRSSCSDVKVIETRKFVQNTCRVCVTHSFERFEKKQINKANQGNTLKVNDCPHFST